MRFHDRIYQMLYTKQFCCKECGMATEDVYFSGHLVLSHSGTGMYSNVETFLSCK